MFSPGRGLGIIRCDLLVSKRKKLRLRRKESRSRDFPGFILQDSALLLWFSSESKALASDEDPGGQKVPGGHRRTGFRNVASEDGSCGPLEAASSTC